MYYIHMYTYDKIHKHMRKYGTRRLSPPVAVTLASDNS